MIHCSNVIDSCMFLRGFFRDIYIGGSYATAKITRLPVYTENSDIDIFILGPRIIESWALNEILLMHFDTIIFSQSMDYKIPKQFKRISAYKQGIKYDLIFVDTDIDNLIEYGVATTFSRFFLEVTYAKTILIPIKNTLVRAALSNILLLNTVYLINKDVATIDHVEKIHLKLNNLGIDFVQ